MIPSNASACEEASCGTVHRAVTLTAIEEAYALVHDAYVEKGYIAPKANGIRVRPWEACPETATFVARVDGRVVGVTSLAVDSPDLGLPSDHVLADRIDRLREEGGRVCEITNLAISPDYRNTPVFLRLTQACFAQARTLGCKSLFIAISPGHARFFGEILQFECQGEQCSYSDEVEDIVQPMRLRVDMAEKLARHFDHEVGEENAFLYDFYFTSNPYHRFIDTWQILCERAFAAPELLQRLFLIDSPLLFDCTPGELDSIRRRWGDELFWSVWGEAPIAERESPMQGVRLRRRKHSRQKPAA